jgi:chaperone required for assembly of F1-ATPase
VSSSSSSCSDSQSNNSLPSLLAKILRRYRMDMQAGALFCRKTPPRYQQRKTRMRLMQGHWNVLLDGKRIKTPSKAPLAVPSQLLAMAIAAEFQSQSDDYIRPITQPLYRLQWQAQDAAFSRGEMIDRLLAYVDSDPVCLRQPLAPTTRKVRAAQHLAQRAVAMFVHRAHVSNASARCNPLLAAQACRHTSGACAATGANL